MYKKKHFNLEVIICTASINFNFVWVSVAQLKHLDREVMRDPHPTLLIVRERCSL